MDTLFVGKNFVELPEVGSTNTFATNLLQGQPPEGTVVWSRCQTSGRGQASNQWHSSPDANLTFSLILYPRFLSPSRLFALSKIASLALHGAIKALLPPQEVFIKWPNDILLGRRKVAGILVENQLDGQGIQSSIIGIGLNVNEADFPPALQNTAISLAEALGRTLDLDALLAQLLGRLEALYLQLRSGNTYAMDRAYLQALYGYQEHVPMRIGGVEERPMLVGVDHSGRLALEREGKLQYFQMKELTFLL